MFIHVTNNDPRHIAVYFLQLAIKAGGIPLKVTTDYGSETVDMATWQMYLSPQHGVIEGRQVTVEEASNRMHFTKSTRNQRIEQLWSQMMNQNNKSVIQLIRKSLSSGPGIVSDGTGGPAVPDFLQASTSQSSTHPHQLPPTLTSKPWFLYEPQMKALVVRWLIDGQNPDDINAQISYTIHPKTMSRWLSLFNRTHSVIVDPSTYGDRGRPLAISTEEREFLLDVLEHEPTLYLDEIQSFLESMTGVRYPTSTIHDDLHNRLQLTKKVANTVHPAQSALRRANYTCQVAQIPSSYLVFIDEAGVSKDTHRRNKGWAKKGKRTRRIHRTHDAIHINLLPAVCLDGLLCSIAQSGSIVRLDLEYFIEEVLIPCMNPFPGPNSVLIMDNAQIHHGGRIQQICNDNQIVLLYLPPYSPDFNPIEKVFSVLKSRLKRAQILTGTLDDAEIIKRFLPTFVTPQLMRALFSSCGYS
ncbi:hypothetical protein MJO28_008749 [Puccinia striiformis f. sp. tritici]|uniref:Uncharacterized protein n=1 Tax=Puccinia striiformis f. sp. tritici TaxID=168172 RepID=A0ACC0ECV7_9BASI|nr:hypothetical protein MJO28_008749 [Puccinia striiformis f. sp. tritici]KAI7952998.1 hypothetical protein MJO29_008629 [Puccinia striiformis f. sp. tritici]